jgi:LuxR family maltose regulon positive regulatory protein
MGVNLYLPYVLVLKAISFEALAERKQALETLRKALRLAESEDHIRPFFENRKSLTNLFDLLNERHHPGEFFKRILTIIKQDQFPSIDRTSSAQQTYLHEPLSERELEVLRFLNSHLSSTEIADELTISANTVRFHIKNIYGKLNVHRRLDAVQKAKDLRLF